MKPVLEFVTRLTYNIEGLSPGLKLYLSQFITFHFSKTLSVEVIQNIENKKASKAFRNDEELQEASSAFSEDERAWCVAVVKLLKKRAEESGDELFSIKLGRLVAGLTSTLRLPDETAIDAELTGIEQELAEYQNRRVIRIHSKIWPLVVDFLLRVAILVYFGLTGSDFSLLPAINSTPVLVIMLVIAYIASRRDRKYNTKMLENYGGVHRYRIQFEFTAAQYTLLAVFLGTGVFITYLLPDQLYVLAFIGLTGYYFLHLRFFRVGRINENDLVRLVAQAPERRAHDFDQNDEEIVEIETKLNSFTSRLDAYVLESALFGALTFSGFLQIMASDLVSFSDLENFSRYIFDTARAALYLDSAAFYTGLANLSNKVSLLCLVSVESLICSGFFLAVIASRLRFSDVADRVTSSLNVAKTYNSKEEALLAEHEVIERRPGRLQDLTRKVAEQITIASEALDKVNPVMMYMRYFRNAGILVFVVILISSTLFITGVLGWAFIAVVAATYAYFNFGRLTNSARALYLELRIKFTSRAGLSLAIASLPLFLSPFFSGTSYWKVAQLLLALGYVTLALYAFMWLLLAAHVDEDFGDIEKFDKKDISRASRWQFVKNIFAVALLIFGFGLAFKELHLRGADELILITLMVMSILAYFFGYYLSKIRWLGVVCGVLLAICCDGILFKILHLSGANEMLYIGATGLVVQIPIILIKRRSVHRLFLRLLGAVALVVFMIASDLLFRLEVMTSHRTFNIAPIADVLRENMAEEIIKDPSRINDAVKRANWYIDTYQAAPGYTAVYRGLVRNYDNLTEYVLFQKGDSTMIRSAILAARESDRIKWMFKYDPDIFDPSDSMTESELLLLLGKKEQALKSLETILGQTQSAEFKKTIADRIILVKNMP